MDERDTHKLEGLLKARSEDIARRRSLRAGRPAENAEAAPRPRDGGVPAGGSPRPCRDCSRGIGPRRMLAMPAATRCLDCQRAFELTPQSA